MKKSERVRIMVALTTNDQLGRVVVSLDSYLRFSNEITCDLELFEDQVRERRGRGKSLEHAMSDNVTRGH